MFYRYREKFIDIARKFDTIEGINIVLKRFRYDIEYRYRYRKLLYRIDRFRYFYQIFINRND